MAILEIKDIKKNFGSNEVLKGISFEVEKGEVVAIIGSSGSGKTTLLRCMNFLETADSGQIVVNNEVLFDGSDTKTKGSKDIRKATLHFGLVFQQFNLFPHYNILKNVTLAKELLIKEEIKNAIKQIKKDNKGKSRKEINELIKEVKGNQNCENKVDGLALLEKVGLADRAKAYPCELSGGQQQRVAIARALALSPDILCFDEPTSALDPELTGEVLKVIKSLKSKDNTMVIVTHEMGFARNVADKVIFMANGVIEEMGTPYEIFENPKSELLKNFLQKSFENVANVD